ncbi:MAG: cation-translocating P-type ATPase [Anaerolineae bacterium]
MSSQPIHALRADEVFAALETSANGLSSQEANARLALYGPNVVREPPPPPVWRRFAGFVTYPMALLLWGAGALALLTGRPAMTIIIWLVVLVNAGFSFWREYRVGQAISALKQLLPAHARVMRDGVEVDALASDLVSGDLLVLGEGDRVPADARVVEEYGLRVDNSTLTGEATPARKSAEPSLNEGLTELEHPNLIFAGTSVYSGTARAVVYATGMQTQFGRIANLTEQVRDEESPLQKRFARLTRRITYLAFLLGGLIMLIQVADLRLDIDEAAIFAIGIVVAMVPEGLPATITLSLAMAVQRLARRDVLVKKLADVETLGAVSVICTDKSGTLTQNQMTVRELWVNRRRLTVDGVGYKPEGRILDHGRPVQALEDAGVRALLTAAALCNNARLIPPSADRPRWTCLGDQTEAALRCAALKGGLDEQALSCAFPRLHELPFDARRKRMSTIHRIADSKLETFDIAPLPSTLDTQSPIPNPKSKIAREVAFVKGAPKEVLQLCTHILLDGQTRPLDDALRAEIVAANDGYARNALRVLALAWRELPARSAGAEASPGASYTVERVERGLTFLGLMALMDPPRPEIAQAVQTCRQAGIRWVMLTGDYGLTAESLARRIGLLEPANGRRDAQASQSQTAPSRSFRLLTGADIDDMTDAELQAALEGDVVCARMAPDHKLRVVSAFQARGDVVAVIGDGVNDAPALRRADIGIAMGVTGSDVAKEAANVILTRDNFSAIVNAIEEGRAIYDNIRKVMTYIFASNVPEVAPFIVSALLNIPLALTIMQVLAIDLGTDLLPAMALGVEKPEPDIMHRPPVRRASALIDRKLFVRATVMIGVAQTVLGYLGFFLVYQQAGFTSLFGLPPLATQLAEPLAQTAALATTVFHVGVVTAQIGNAFACRTEHGSVRRAGVFSNRSLWAAIGFELALICALVYVPFLSPIFDHAPMPLEYWPLLLAYAPVVYVLDWIRKAVLRRRQSKGKDGGRAATGFNRVASPIRRGRER